MAKVPPEIQEGIKKLAEINKIPVQTIVERLKEILQTDETIKTMEKEDFKVRYAWSVVYREYTNTSKAIDCFLTPLLHPRVREVTMKGDKVFVGDVSCLVQRVEKDDEGNVTGYSDPFYASGTFWREGAKNAQKLVPGKVYRSSIILKDNKWGTTISSDRAGFTEVTDHPMIQMKEYYESVIKPKNIHITIGEMDLNKNEYSTDIRTITATVTEASVGEKDGREYGRYSVMDESIYGSNFTIWMHPKDIIWSPGSLLIIGGTIDVNTKTNVTSFSCQFVLPTDLSEPLKLVPKPPKRPEDVDTSIDISLDTKDAKTEPAKPKIDEFNIEV